MPAMKTTSSRDAWNDFWAVNARGGGVDGGTGCLPRRWAAIESTQRSTWTEYAEAIPQGARVLDLATGDGRVLAWLKAARDDLDLMGVDLSPTLPPAPPGISIRSAIPMENLPFEDGAYDTVISQFGLEYGHTALVAAEIARVLKEDGRAAFIVHRGDGPILEHNRERRSQLLWALREKAVARKVKTRLQRGASAIDEAAAFAAKIAGEGAQKYGQSSPAWEIPEAIRRSCIMGRASGTASIVETIDTIEAHARNEIGRIASLSAACGRADKRDYLVSQFERHGLKLGETRELKEPSGRAFADFLTFA
jgi:SAM-dependent methyltransferase